MRPIFSEIDDIYDSLLFVIVKAVYILPLKHLHSLTYYLAYYLSLLYKYLKKISMFISNYIFFFSVTIREK